MPTDLVKQLAQKRGLQVSAVEATWNDAKEAAADAGHDEDWPYVMKIFQYMIGKNEMTTSAMAAPYGIPLGQIVRELPPPAKRKREEEAVRAGVRYAYEMDLAGAQIAAQGLASDRRIREAAGGDPLAKNLHVSIGRPLADLERSAKLASDRLSSQEVRKDKDAQVLWHDVYAALAQAGKLVDEARDSLLVLGRGEKNG